MYLYFMYFFNEFIYEACWVVLLLIILIFIFLFFSLCDVLCLLYDAATLLELPLVGLIKLLT